MKRPIRLFREATSLDASAGRDHEGTSRANYGKGLLLDFLAIRHSRPAESLPLHLVREGGGLRREEEERSRRSSIESFS